MRPGSVLICDDDALLRDTLGDCLGALGWRVATAGNGLGAVDSLAASPFDLLVSDVDMPGLSGFAVLAWARERVRDLPVVLMSGRADAALAQAARTAGARALLPKPVDIGRFTSLVGTL